LLALKDYQINKAEPADADDLAALVHSAYRGDYARQGWTTEADLIDGTRTDSQFIRDLINTKGTMILKFEHGGSISGCVELILQPPKLYVGMLTVDPSLQGKGVGKILLSAAEEFGLTHGCVAINMTVITARTELIDWYIRHGYVDTGERKPFAFTDPRFGKPKKPLEFMVLEKKIL
jgi:ribosomal protein S18 acetylase RimI-like enzyme